VLAFNLALAVPRTLTELYQETSGPAAWIVLIGFAMVAITLIVALLHARTSPWRLPLAVALIPLTVSLVFMALQGFMVLMIDTFYWFTTLAPYTVACPILCTAYWVIRPNADRGITASLAHAILRVLEPGRA
jgi:ABC-type Fe3+-siderophore transport system permease subunit